MRFATTFSGIEACSVAWCPMGWEAAWFAETDPYRCAVLRHWFPEVPNLGDVEGLLEHDVARGERLELVHGSSPCQDFSVAGQRAGLDGARGDLTRAFLRVVGGLRPRWVTWENVPGAMQTDGGRALGAVLGALSNLGYGFAWRVLDARFFGVPQRRRRVFVVGRLGGDPRPAAAVLFDSACLRGDPSSRRKARATAAGALAGGSGGRGHRLGADEAAGRQLVAGTLRGSGNGTARTGAVGSDAGMCVVAFDETQITSRENRCRPEPGDPCHPLPARGRAPTIARCLTSRQTRLDGDGETFLVEGDSAASTPDLPRLRSGCGRAGETAVVRTEAFACHGGDVGRFGSLRKGHGDVQSGVPFCLDTRQDPTALEDVSVPLGRKDNGHGVSVSVEALTRQDIEADSCPHAYSQEANPRAALRELREQVGTKEVSERGSGVSRLLQPPEVLRSNVHGAGVRCETDEGESWMDDGSLACEKNDRSREVRAVRKNDNARRSSSQPELAGQQGRESGSSLSRVSHSRAQTLWTVRRLVPLEAERLMGLPDDWTLIPWGSGLRRQKDWPELRDWHLRRHPDWTKEYVGSLAADSVRYRALGDSMVVPVLAWIGARIEWVDEVLAVREIVGDEGMRRMLEDAGLLEVTS